MRGPTTSSPLCLALGVVLLCVCRAAAAFSVHFDQDVYAVLPFETLVAQVLFDYDDTIPGDQAPPLGLFSMGLEMFFPETLARVPTEDAIVIPDPLNGDGTGGPPQKRVGAGFAGATGALDLFASEGYMAPLLTTFTVETLAAEGFTLALDFYFKDTRANFVDFGGTLLDPGISFASATVQIIPEPATLALLAAGISMLAFRRRHA